MKLKTNQENVKSSGNLGETKLFSIRANAHAFRMLSSGLYSDKIGAVLREIACNAFDAHVAAGIVEKPIRVKIPNSMDDQFYVQDWGPGMTHEEIMDLYTSYFGTTKHTSNDFTGAFGLGSKSPFSYTDSFTVVSVCGGKKRTYSMYLDNNGEPSVSLMTTEQADSDWRSGIRVGFAVQPKDYNEFLVKAKSVLQWFRVLPEMKGTALKLEHPKPLFEGATFSAIQEQALACTMGNVRYPLDMGKVVGANKDPSKAPKLQFFQRLNNIVIHLPIGHVTPTASRESLDYCPETVTNLVGTIESVVDDLMNITINTVDEMTKGGWDAVCENKQDVENFRHTRLLNNLSEGLALAGIKDERAKDIHAALNDRHVTIHQSRLPGNMASLFVAKPYTSGKVEYKRLSGSSTYLDFKKNTRIIVANSKTKHTQARVKHAIRSGVFPQALVVCGTKMFETSDTNIANRAEELQRRLFDMPIVDAGTLEIPVKEQQLASNRKRKTKNWTPALPDIKVETWGLTSDAEMVSLTDFDAKDRIFFCYTNASHEGRRWSRSAGRHWRRMLHPSLKEDSFYDEGYRAAGPVEAWDLYRQLVKWLGITNRVPTKVALVDTNTLKRSYMQQLGWKFGMTALKETAESDLVRRLIKRRLSQYYPSAPDNEHEAISQGFASLFAHYHEQGNLDKDVFHRLEEIGYADIIKKMVAAKNGPAHKLPELSTCVEQLCSILKVSSPDLEVPLSVSEINEKLVERFPRLKYFDPRDLYMIKGKDPVAFRQYVLFLLGDPE